jgi:hypothetical protein
VQNENELSNIPAQVPNLELESDETSTQYNPAERLMVMFEDIMFADLFTQPWDQIVPRIVTNIEHAAQAGLFADSSALKAEFLKQGSACTGQTLRSIMESQWPTGSSRAESLAAPFEFLFTQGILFRLESSADLTGSVQRPGEVIDNLITHAGSFTYRSMYESRETDISAEAREATGEAIRGGILLSGGQPERCCSPTGCVPIEGRTDLWCNGWMGRCQVDSTPCPDITAP